MDSDSVIHVLFCNTCIQETNHPPSGKYETCKECEVDLLCMGYIYSLFNTCYLESFVCITSEVGYEYCWEEYY
jgi:hypothetical protein